MKFTYTAVRPDGHEVTGVYRADSREAAELALYDLDMRGVRLEEKKSLLQLELTAPRVKREEVMHLSRQLGAFIAAGLTIVDAVHTLGAEASNFAIRKMMAGVEEGLRRGDTLSDCFDQHPKVFPEFYRGILRSAELTGQLDTVLSQLARYLERDLEARRRITSAMIYPIMIAVMSVVTVVILAGFVLPRFRTFFADLDAELPLTTRMMLAATDFVTNWWWAMLAAAATGTLALVAALRTDSGRHAVERFLLRVPVLGTTIQFTLVERFCRIFASMVSAGVPLPSALHVATSSLRNLVFVRALNQVSERVLQGEGLAWPLSHTGLFPGTAARMIRVGEETGTLDAQLEVTAKYYEGELDYKLKKLTALFEPVMIIVMGGIVGFVAIALVSAMYGIFNQVHI
ncbi:pilus assembly protein PilC [Actinoplanes lobatus]|uniref:Pilus assembly protein PilC n=1 Tax=Actinoplanes lobatus TaxID=113568 RepID=A0A7W7H915_9ACTN|nr:type II secretion system F family protein [Actinoplanes lobatus]MBB4746229.1 type IV pilus assembly protein PilC [Actinoplanes lobatus]GGN61220.1 pilus assembly protein PilC [Actinoplanes lobatus]GIE41437.1 pilus assembly protein PilC [Actinoplanes lobatus]